MPEIYIVRWKDRTHSLMFGAPEGMLKALDRIGDPSNAEVRVVLGPGEEVTWQARHFGVVQRLKVRMAHLDRPVYFQDIMVEGAFRSMSHDHTFEEAAGGTVMKDRFEFAAPLGVRGRLAESLFLTSYMRRFFVERNAVLKRTAESNEWRKYLPDETKGPPNPGDLRR